MKARSNARVAGIAAGTLLAIAAAASANAASDQAVYRTAYPVELAYDNLVTGGVADYVMFVGRPGPDGGDAGAASPVMTMNVKPTGPTTDMYSLTGRTHAELYEYTDGRLFELLDEYCADGWPQPYATGDGVLKVWGTSEYASDYEVNADNWYVDAFAGPNPDELDRYDHNWFRGSLRTQGGDAIQVKGYADVPTFYGFPAVVSIDVWGGRP